jgi:anaerobic magnesium-protoporphyrin IX monomethyl ester cyclase
MKTWICTTLAHFLGPHQGVARLYAYLKNQGFDAALKDFNQDAYFALLSKEFLWQTFQRLKQVTDSTKRSKFLREDIGSILIHSSNTALKCLLARGILLDSGSRRFAVNNIVKKPLTAFIGSRIKADNVFFALLSQQDYIISEVERAGTALEKEFLRLAPDEFLSHFCTLLCGKAVIDATFFPAQLDFGLGFHGTAYNPHAGDVLRSTTDEAHNFLLPYFRQRVVPQVSRECPEIIGISITHSSEFVPAFTLARSVKACHPEAHICLGGAAVTEVAHRIIKNPLLWDLFDSLITGPGEYAFCELINTLESKGDMAKVPNLVYKKNGSIKKSEKFHDFDINDAFTPEYVGLKPGSGVALETASGCYWGKCIYCYYPKQGTANLQREQEKKRVRNIEAVLEDIRKLRDKYDPIYIGITDSCIHPRRLMQIAEQNIKSEKKVNFTAFVRFEKEFKSPEFCDRLAEGGFLGGQIGLESGSQRVNDIINKGVALDDARIIISNLYKSGILIHLYTLIGVPGETPKEASMTYEFLKRRHHMITLDWQLYSIYLLEHSALAARASEFGIEPLPLPDEFLVEAMRYNIDQELSQEASVAASIRYNEKLKRFLHPLNNIMDIESVKLFLLAQKSKGIPPNKIKPRLL